MLVSVKILATSKETISKVKRQPSEWEKRIANEETDKGLISKIYQQLLQLSYTTKESIRNVEYWPHVGHTYPYPRI